MKTSPNSPSKQRRNPRPNLEKLREEKRKFLKEFSSKYGYNGKIDQIREEEYPQLKNEIYLDHTGATTFAKSAVTNFTQDILTNLYGNPHSQSPSSAASSKKVADVRNRILKHFSTTEKDYSVIFTTNATAAIKLVGEMFPWTEQSTYKYLRESHNSINGLRRFLEVINSDNTLNVTENDVKSIIRSASRNNNNNANQNYHHEYRNDDKVTYNLFAYPAQCNFSGMKFPLSWCHKIKRTDTKNSRTLVLLDAAAYVPSSPLSLANKETSPDFICLSFYKMFGYPTGLGALIVKNELAPILRKGYFGGGTLDSIAFDQNWVRLIKDLSPRYEDGTVNFLNIIALDHAFDAFEKIYGNMKNISNHVNSLVTYLSRSMAAFHHWNGQPVCKINSDRDFSDSKAQGGVVSFNVKRSDGSPMGYYAVDKLASLYGIHIRSGGNCNPGSLFRWNGLYSDEVKLGFEEEGKVCYDEKDYYRGKLYGAARLSIGAMTTIEDILVWLDFFKRYFVEITPGKTAHDVNKAHLKKTLGSRSKHNLHDKSTHDIPTNNSKHDVSKLFNMPANNSKVYNFPINYSKRDVRDVSSSHSEEEEEDHDENQLYNPSKHGSGKRLSKQIYDNDYPSKLSINKPASRHINKHERQHRSQQRRSFAHNLKNFIYN